MARDPHFPGTAGFQARRASGKPMAGALCCPLPLAAQPPLAVLSAFQLLLCRASVRVLFVARTSRRARRSRPTSGRPPAGMPVAHWRCARRRRPPGARTARRAVPAPPRNAEAFRYKMPCTKPSADLWLLTSGLCLLFPVSCPLSSGLFPSAPQRLCGRTPSHFSGLPPPSERGGVPLQNALREALCGPLAFDLRPLPPVPCLLSPVLRPFPLCASAPLRENPSPRIRHGWNICPAPTLPAVLCPLSSVLSGGTRNSEQEDIAHQRASTRTCAAGRPSASTVSVNRPGVRALWRMANARPW